MRLKGNIFKKINLNKNLFTENIRKEVYKCKNDESNNSYVSNNPLHTSKGGYLYSRVDPDNKPIDELHRSKDTTMDQRGKLLSESRYHEKDKVDFIEEKKEDEDSIQKYLERRFSK